MKYLKSCLIVVSVAVVLALVAQPVRSSDIRYQPGGFGQTRKPQPARGGATGAQSAKPTPAPVAPAPTAVAAPSPLAIVNNKQIMLSDLDPKARETLTAIDQQISNVRRSLLESRINQMVAEDEAKKRGITVQQLYQAEINDRVIGPTDADISAAYNANLDQFQGADPQSVRPQIMAYLRDQRARDLASELYTRLRAAHAIKMAPVDPDASNLAPSTVLATVDGRPVTAGTIEDQARPIRYELRLRAYETEKAAVDQIIDDTLLHAEAARRNIAPEQIMKTEVVDKLRPVTDAEVTRFYQENKSQIPVDEATARPQIASYLEQKQRLELELNLVTALRKNANVRVFLVEPEPVVFPINPASGPSRGPANAPVTIVEFTDFQCPACAAMSPVIEETLKKYPTQVRLVVRDFPLTMHQNARKAAEAAHAANAQGRFFEYIAILFQHQDALDVASLKKYAGDLGLDRARFDSELDRGVYAADVQRSVTEGEHYGISSTPSIYVNGVLLREASANGLKEAIDRALARGAKPAPESVQK